MTELLKVDLVGVGLNALDTLIPLSSFPARGSKTEYTSASIMPGGQAATTVIACQTWGLTTRYVGKVGDDEAANLHRREFVRTGVDARLTTVANAASPQSLILVDSGGERTVLCRRDERLLLQPSDLDRSWIVNARALHVDGFETAAATIAAEWARAAGIPVIADLDEIYPAVEDLIANVDYLIVSRVRAWDGNRFHASPAYQVPVTDTTGAGDIFHAGFIYGLLQDWPLDRQLDFACAAAALNCTAAGARGGIGPVEAIEDLMAQTPRYAAAPAAD
jgi:sulfofructose kinase